MRKIGDRSGIGFSNAGGTDKEVKKKFDVSSYENQIEEKIRKEAELIFQTRREMGGENILDRLDVYSDRFKLSMKNQFRSSFVSSGTINTAKKEATITFIKKQEAQNPNEENAEAKKE